MGYGWTSINAEQCVRVAADILHEAIEKNLLP
jgi:hypothetical protein